MAANLKAKISLDTSAFKRGIASISRQVSAMAAQAVRTGVVMSAALGTAAFAGLAAGVKQTLAAGDALANLGARTGAPLKDLILLQEAFKQADIGAEGVGPALNKMQKALTGVNEKGEPTKKMFGQLGLSMDGLKKLAPAAQFQAIGAAIMQLGDPAERAAAAMDIFGRSGGEIMQVFANPRALEEAGQALGGQADVMAKNAAAFGRVSDQFDMIGTKLMGFFAGVTESVLPSLEAAGNWIASLDLSGIGKRFGDALQSGINILVNAFKQGELGNLIGLAIKAGSLRGLDFLISAFVGIGNALGEIVGQAFALLFEPSFWSAMVQGFIAAANQMGIAFVTIMETPLRWLVEKINLVTNPLRELMGKKALSNDQAWQATFGGEGSITDDMKKNADAATAKAGQAILDLQGKGILSAEEIKKAFMTQFDKGGILGDQIKATEDELMALASRLNVPIADVQAALAGPEMPGGKLAPAAEKPDKFAGVQKIEAASALERIGALMGGGGPSAALANNTRDTAANTRKTNVLLEKIIGDGKSTSLVPAYGV